MSWDFSTTTEQLARKDYDCDASNWVMHGADHVDISSEDQAIIDKARTEGWKINKGTHYIKTTGFWNCEPSTVRARKDMDQICRKYGLYD